MTKVAFGKLEDLAPKDAWSHEAHDFTPWLADNIDEIAAAIGVPLELTDTEVAVETFAADIVARNPQDDTVVLIENQLAKTDHTHLGQIMTYLAGLEAQTVIWISPEFREPHLSAIRWLNQHTADGFSFFAIRLRVVKIADSPYAPVFEVLEQPNEWDREIKQKTAATGASYYDVKKRFWEGLLDTHPDLADLGFKAWRYPNNYLTLHENPRIDLSLWLGKRDSGAFVRPAHGAPIEPVLDVLAPHVAALEGRLGTSFGPSGKHNHLLVKTLDKGHEHEEDWPSIMDWMRHMVSDYQYAFSDIRAGAGQ